MERAIANNPLVCKWVEEVASLCTPDRIHWVEGNELEKKFLQELLVKTKTFTPLNDTLRPNSFLARSNPDDVARVEDRTFICSEKQEDAGPTNNWKDPQEMRKTLLPLFSHCMRGRVLYVVPFCMGPFGSPYARTAVEITDSPYVVLSMMLMTRVGKQALELLNGKEFVKCLHSVGKPIIHKNDDVAWPCNPKQLYISHFPEKNEVWSFGSGYGGNALLNKKCFALRLASKMAKKEGWLAEHMLIVGITRPDGKKRYFAASFPSACGKTNLAMLAPTLAGWKVECVGDDIAWMHFDSEGQLRAINPEAGFFGVAPGTSFASNPNAMKAIEKNTIFTNVALTDDGDVWWEGMSKTPPKHLIDWKGHGWTPESKEPASQPNARFTVATSQCPIADPFWEDPRGVVISGIIFGGRRATTIPLVRQALDWNHGVFLGATMTSETTAAAKGAIGKLRHDPFAMLPFCGYNMADYFSHWLSMQDKGHTLPQIFYVNWFKKAHDGTFLWPGFGENIRVIKWMFDRIENEASCIKTPIGYLPTEDSFDTKGLVVDTKELFKVDPLEWKKEADESASYLAQFADRLPQVLYTEIERLQHAYK
jgi:phosphoenolpyruvate carboxykinase (GTP)